ncbi:MAG TPA: hypothetical protein VHL59_19565 [Thermoanaerobaculia bacterium]|nr:hypothetical protein [Thermoanaerobaculia bacterium]
MPRNVAVVFTPDFSADLQRLAFHTPVWIVDTPANRAAAEDAWHAAIEWPHITVTLFRASDDWKALLDHIALKEKTIDGVDAIGTALTPTARAALTGFGLQRVEETTQGFRARR